MLIQSIFDQQFLNRRRVGFRAHAIAHLTLRDDKPRLRFDHMNLPRVDFGFGMLDGIAQALGSLPGVTTLQVNTRQCDMRGQQSRMPTQGLPIEFTASCHIHIARTGNWRQTRIFRAHLRSQSQRIQPHVLWIVVTEVSDGVVEVLGRVRHITAKQFGPQNAKSRHKGAICVIYRVSVSDRTGRWRCAQSCDNPSPAQFP